MPSNSKDSQLCTSLGWTPLHIATEQQDTNEVKKLLHSSNINVPDNFKRTPLSIAASKGNIQLTTLFVEAGADVNTGFPLHYASEKGHIEVVRYLVQKGADVNLTKDQNYPLIIAANYGYLEVVKFLVEHGGEIDRRNEQNETALHRACYSDNCDLIAFLVDSGCDVNAADRYDFTPLQVCLSYHEDNPEPMKVLLSKGASLEKYDSQKLSFLHESCNPEATLELIKHGADVNSLDIRNETPLYAACESEYSDCAKTLLQHGADPNIVASGGWTALHLAAKHGDLELVEELVKRNADVNAVGAQNVIPLHLAVKGGHCDVVRLLVEHGSLVDVPIVEVEDVNSYAGKVFKGDGESPLSLARKGGYKDIEEVLQGCRHQTEKSCNATISLVTSDSLDQIKNFSSDDNRLTSRDSLGWTLLHHSVYNRLYDMSCELIKKGLDVNSLDKFERTPLSLAAFSNDVHLIRLLVDNSADVNLGVPLLYAINNQSEEAVLELIKSNCDVNIKNKTFAKHPALVEAAFEGLSSIVTALVENNADVNGVNKYGETALHRACNCGDVESVRVLVDNGADVNSVDICKETPLISAALGASHTVVKILVDKGADVHWLDNSRWTPLHRACRDELSTLELLSAGADVNYFNDNVESPLFIAAAFPKVVRVLLDHNADPSFVAFGGWTPLHESISEGNLESVKLFLDHGIDVNRGSAENVLPVYLAAIGGHCEILQELLNRGSYIDPVILDVGAIRIEPYYFGYGKRYQIVAGNTPLLGAAARGHLGAIKVLLSSGADLKARNAGGNTALHEAAAGGFKDVVKFLVNAGIDASLKNNEKKTALDLAQSEDLITLLS